MHTFIFIFFTVQHRGTNKIGLVVFVLLFINQLYFQTFKS